MSGRFLRGVLCAAVASLVPTVAVTSAAQGATFTVCATGCSFTTITEANASPTVHDGDELVVEPGVYTDAPELTKVLAVHGDPSLPRPVLAPTAEFAYGIKVGVGAAGSVVSHLALEPTDTFNGGGFNSFVPATFSDLLIKAPRSFATSSSGVVITGVSATQTSNLADLLARGNVLQDVRIDFVAPAQGLELVVIGGGSTIEDSTFSDPGANLPLAIEATPPEATTLRRVRIDGGIGAVYVQGSATVTDSLLTATAGPALRVYKGKVLMRNVTAISSGANGANYPSFGLWARGCEGKGCTTGVIAARNVIARGVEADVAGEAAPASPGAPGEVEIDHSNVLTTSGTVSASAIQSGDPLFVDGTVGPSEDFHLRAGSPAIDAGVSDPFDGPLDLDGAPRVQGAAIDLGAYEFTPPAVTAPVVPIVAPAPARLVLLASSIKIGLLHGTGTLAARCSTSSATDRCSVVGSLTAVVSSTKHRASAHGGAAARLGTVTGAVLGGRSGHLVVRLTRKALATLRRHKSLSAVLTAVVTSAGGTSKVKVRVRLVLAPAPKHRR